MAGQANGGQVAKPNPLNQGKYVGNPNHIAQTQAVRNPNHSMYVPPTSNGLMTGGANDLRDRMKPFLDAQGKLVAEPTPTISQTPGLQGIRDANGNLVTNNVGYGDGSANNQSFMQMPNRTAPQPANINTMAAQGIQGAGLGTAQGMGYQPLSVNANQLSNTNLSPYMNQYTDEVVKANEADILRGAQIGLDHLGSQASMANAYGGSRHGVAMGEMGRGVAQQLAQSSAGLRQAGYTNAQQAALQDIQNNMQGQLANQQADLSGQSQRLGAAGQLADISNLGFGMGQTVNQNLMAQGAMQQALQQQIFDAAANKYQGYVGHPAQGLAYLNAALGVTPTTPQTTTTSKQPGLFDYLTLGASGYTGS